MAKGRGKTKIEQGGVVRKVGMEHGSPIIRLPKSLVDLGLKLSQEIFIQVEKDVNPLLWEIKIKPLPVEQLEETACKSNSK